LNNLQFLKNATLTELTTIKGIGKIKAIELKAAIEFGCRVYQSTQVKYGKISSSHQIAQRLIQEMKGLQQEHLICIYLNTKNEVIRQETMFKGFESKHCSSSRRFSRSREICSCQNSLST
jgi:DNA repair protein RadC